jgi:hypothetical protein
MLAVLLVAEAGLSLGVDAASKHHDGKITDLSDKSSKHIKQALNLRIK